MTRPSLASAPTVVAILIGYVVVHAGLRLAFGPVLGVDDSEQALFAQAWSWTYRFKAPPLFTWVLLAVQQVTGPGILAITLVRYLFYAVILLVHYATARRLLVHARLAAAATFSFAAIYVYGFYSHHDLTHTTAMTAMLALAWYVVVRLAETPTLGWYLALGATTGLGLLGKWNFAMFAGGLVLACLSRRDWRPLLFTWRIVPAGLLAVAIIAPTVIATLRLGAAEGDDAAAAIGAAPADRAAAVALGLGRLALSTLAHPMPFLILFGIAFGAALWRGVRRGGEPAVAVDRVDPGFLARAIGAVLALHVALVLATQATAITERLLQPALYPLPLLLFMLAERGGIGERGVRLYLVLVAAVAAVAIAARIVIQAGGADLCRTCRTFVPYPALADALRRAGFPGTGTILVPDFNTGGNLRVFFPEARVLPAGYPPAIFGPPRGGACLLVWPESRRTAAEPPPRVLALLNGPLGGALGSEATGGEAAAPLAGTDRPFRWYYRLMPGGTGDCR